MKRIFPILLCFLLLTGCQQNKTEIQGFSMDSSYRIDAEGISNELETDIRSYLNNIDSVLNVYREDSRISMLNENKVLVVSDAKDELLFDLIKRTLPYCNDTFDISIRPVSKLWNFKSENPALPNQEELAQNLASVGYWNIKLSDDSVQLENGAEIEGGAVVKGYVCDRVAEKLSGNTALIDIGGTIKTVGKDITAGVKSPDHNGLLCSFTLKDGKAVSTSGSYERSFQLDGKLYHHILNPKTGYPTTTDFVSVTVICDSALEADIFSTTLFAENSFRIPKSAEVIYVTNDHLVYISPGIENFKLLNGDYQTINLTEE